MTSSEIIQQLDLKPHPEGGFYKETYRCEEQMITKENRKRAVCTGIYFMLENDNISHFHRIQSDETWLFHQGATIELVYIFDKKLHTIFLGNDLTNGEVPQFVIPAKAWFAARVKNQKGHSLVSCMVAPGFDFADFEMGKRSVLLQEFSQFKNQIETFTLGE